MNLLMKQKINTMTLMWLILGTINGNTKLGNEILKLKLALIMIFFMAVLGSGYLYLNKDYKKEVEFVEYKSKNNNVDYSNYVQLTPNIPKNKKNSDSNSRRLINLGWF